jgi:hypothetical protein
MTPHESISLKIAELSDSILSSHPTMPSLLRDIHHNLKQDPELVTLLSSSEVAAIVSGLSRQTQTTISTQILTKSKGKKVSDLSDDDLGL